MANKLDRIEKDIEKTKAKIAELQKQLRELEAAKTEQENLQIIQLVRGLNMKPEEFAAFLRGGALQSAPAGNYRRKTHYGRHGAGGRTCYPGGQCNTGG